MPMRPLHTKSLETLNLHNNDHSVIVCIKDSCIRVALKLTLNGLLATHHWCQG